MQHSRTEICFRTTKINE